MFVSKTLKRTYGAFASGLRAAATMFPMKTSGADIGEAWKTHGLW